MSLLVQGQIKKNAESSFVNSFLKNIASIFHKDDFMIIQEAYAESGIPDIILLSWKKEEIPTWNNERMKLEKLDLNILHFLYSGRRRKNTLSSLQKLLGYSKNTLVKSLTRLAKSEMLFFNDGKIILKKLNEIFIVDEIISIEAKLNNKRKVTHQALMNQNFSSKSYILMPENKYKNSSFFYDSDSIGCITYNGEKSKINKRPRKSKIPGSAYSWILNEHVIKTIHEERIKSTY